MFTLTEAKPVKRDEVYTILLQALARGYCSPKNKEKIVDPELIEAMAEEVIAVLPLDCDD